MSNSGTKTILVINGPNLNLLGYREPEIYGTTTLQDITTNLTNLAKKEHNIKIQHFQSNHEGQILDRIHACLLGHLPQPLSSKEYNSTDTISSTTTTTTTTTNTETKVPTAASTPRPDGIIINPGALTHSSIALRDALLGVNVPFIEIHISNVHTREPFRHHSYLSDKAEAVIAGLGVFGYEAALRYWAGKWSKQSK